MISLEEHYEKICQVGQGTYGQVFKARPLATTSKDAPIFYALKKIRTDTEKEGFPVTAVREIKLLQRLDHPNIIRLKQIAHSKSDAIFLVFDYLPHDLSGLLHQPQIRNVGFSSDIVAFIMKQIFEALAYLHSNDVVHRDIKASNILLSNTGRVQLADFGLAKQMTSRSPESFQRYFMTNRVCTIWYRAPELLLGSIKYGPEVDIWSAGCVMAELLKGKPLFVGENEFAQLDLITKKLPLTEAEATALNSLPWAHLFKSTVHDRECIIHDPDDKEAEDLLRKCFKFIPKERITAKEALKHPFFKRANNDKFVLPDTDWHEYESTKSKKQMHVNASKDASDK